MLALSEFRSLHFFPSAGELAELTRHLKQHSSYFCSLHVSERTTSLKLLLRVFQSLLSLELGESNKIPTGLGFFFVFFNESKQEQFTSVGCGDWLRAW